MQQIITKSAAIRGKRNISAALCRRGFCAWQLVASLFLRRHPDGRDVRNGKEIENKGKLRDRKRGTDGSANANKLNVMGRSDRTVVSLSREATDRGERIRCMPQIGSNIYAIGMITALRDYVRLLRAIPMLTLLYHHQHPPPPLSIPPCLPQPTSTSRINGKSGLLNDRSRDTCIVRAGHATSASKTFLLA